MGSLNGWIRRHVGWVFAIAGAVALTLFMPTQHYLADLVTARVARQHGATPPPIAPWSGRLLGEAAGWLGFLLISAVSYQLAKRFPLIGPRKYRNLGVHLPAAFVLVGLLSAGLLVAAPPQLPWAEVSFVDRMGIVALRYFGTFLMLYAGILGVQHAALYYRAYQTREMQTTALESQLANAQLDVLKMQLQPHFLFNTLNTIASLLYKDIGGAQRMIVRLSDLLRLSLESSTSHEVSLEEEVQFLEQYVEIQRVRFQDRLTVEYEIDEECRRLLVPRLILQPLVENSIRHGIGESARSAQIEVAAFCEGGRLVLEVRDNGSGLASVVNRGNAPGIGIRNTRARLKQLYGSEQSMSFYDVQPRGLTARIEIPARHEGRNGKPPVAASRTGALAS